MPMEQMEPWPYPWMSGTETAKPKGQGLQVLLSVKGAIKLHPLVQELACAACPLSRILDRETGYKA